MDHATLADGTRQVIAAATAPADDHAGLFIIAGIGLAVLIMVYFGVRYWLVTTRPPAIKDVETPNVDRLNRNALQHMAEETLEEDEAETQALSEEDSPADLKAIVPDEPEAGAKK